MGVDKIVGRKAEPGLDHQLEDRRQIEHMVPLAIAFLLPWLNPMVVFMLGLTGLLYALHISPHWLGVTTRREEQLRGFSIAKISYTLAVLFVLLVFSDRVFIAAGTWAILAVGDALSNLVGRHLGGPRLFYNRSKTVGGSVAFSLGGGAVAYMVMAWTVPADFPHSSVALLTAAFLVAFICALAESLLRVADDNLVIAWTGSLAFHLLFTASRSPLHWHGSPTHAVAVNVAAVTLAWGLRWLSNRAAALAGVFGIVIFVGLGPEGYLLIVIFAVLASLATRAGWATKLKSGLQELAQGRRGVSNVLSNGLVAVTLAFYGWWSEATVLRVAYAAAVATGVFDTLASEIGQWLGRRPISPVSLRQVARGTPGAVSIQGTMAGLCGAFIIGVTASWLSWLPWEALPVVVLSALGGSLFESVVQSLSRREADDSHQHHVLNLFNTLFGACVAITLWSFLARR